MNVPVTDSLKCEYIGDLDTDSNRFNWRDDAT